MTQSFTSRHVTLSGYSRCAFLLAGFNIFTSSFFTALGNGAISAAVSFMRTLIFQVSSILILPLIFGVDGIWMANVVAEFFSLSCCR